MCDYEYLKGKSLNLSWFIANTYGVLIFVVGILQSLETLNATSGATSHVISGDQFNNNVIIFVILLLK